MDRGLPAPKGCRGKAPSAVNIDVLRKSPKRGSKRPRIRSKTYEKQAPREPQRRPKSTTWSPKDALMLSCYHTLIISYSDTLILAYSHTLILLYSHTLIPSYSHTLILSYSHALILSYSRTLLLSYSHALNRRRAREARE